MIADEKIQEIINSRHATFGRNDLHATRLSLQHRQVKAFESIAESLKLAPTPAVQTAELVEVGGLEGRTVNIVDCSNVTVHP